MTSLLDAPPGVLLGDQTPRIWTAPPALSSAGEDAVGLARAAGLDLDPWQRWVLDKALGEKAGGKWSAFEIGIVVGRQNGKGAILEARELAGLFLFGEDLILHTAHQFKTASEAFRRIRILIENTDSLRRRCKKPLTGKGDEAIEVIKTGQRLRYVARSSVSGRGFSGDCVILDEAFELPESSIAALLPTMSARPNPQLWYTSSAVDRDVHREGHVLARLRRRGIAGDSELVYAEWSAGERDGLDERQLAALRSDPGAIVRSNPGVGIRITPEFVERERASLGAKSFDVERLGIGDWPSEDGQQWSVIPRTAWNARIGRRVGPEGPVAYAVAAAWPDAESCAVALATRSGGELLVEVGAHRRGTSWVVPLLADLQARRRPCAVVVDPGGPAGQLVADLEAAGVELVKTSTREAAQAFGQFQTSVVGDAPYLRHFAQPELDAAVAAAQKRPLGDAWTWARKGPTDISPLEAVTLAVWGHATRGYSQAPPAEIF